MMKALFIDPEKFVYQTNCFYQDHGQIIGVVRRTPDELFVYDVSRGIPMTIKMQTQVFDSVNINRYAERIQRRYLYNNYEDASWNRELRDFFLDFIDQLPPKERG